jgi:hypothetical protein
LSCEEETTGQRIPFVLFPSCLLSRNPSGGMAAYGYGSDRSLGSHQAWFKPLQKKRTVEVYEKGLIRGMPKPIEVEEMKSLLEAMGCPERREDRLFELGLFLKGWGGNLQKAAEAYSNTLKWRESFGADSIRDAVRCGGVDDGQAHPFPCAQSIQQAWPHQLVEVDCMCRDGSPFAISRLGMVDTKRLATTVEDEHFEVWPPLDISPPLILSTSPAARIGHACLVF